MSSVRFADDPRGPAKSGGGGGGGGGGGNGPILICTTCRVKFTSMEELRKHYSSEWHSENVRRRVDGRKPLSLHEYKVQKNMADEVEGERHEYYCKICKKYFKSVQTLQAHLKSTEHLLQKEKVILARDSEAASMLTSTSLGSAAIGLHRRAKAHKANAKKHQDPNRKKFDGVITAEDREADVDETRCFYCGFKSDDMDANLAHMNNYHGFTLPLPHRIKDKLGLMQYLARKVNGLICLVCNDETKQMPSLQALRDHMNAKGHEYVVLNSEYDEFYEGGVDDNVAIEKDENETSDKLVVAQDGSKKVVKKREEAVPVHRRAAESDQQLEQRRLITAQQHAANAVIKKERMDLQRKDINKHNKIMQQQQYRYNKFHLRTGLRANKLHPKGYDGEGEVN